MSHARWESHIAQARAIARRHARRAAVADRDDLEAAALEGLAVAADRFDPSRGVPFQAWATPRITGAVKDAASAQRGIPRRIQREGATLATNRSELASQLGREPTSAEQAARLGITPDDLRAREARAAIHVVPIEPDGASELPDVDEPTDEVLVEMERRTMLRAAVGKLPERERHAVLLVYFENLTVTEAARVLGVTPGRVSQLCKAATGRLRAALAGG